MDIPVLVADGGVTDHMVDDRVEQKVLIPFGITLGEHVLRYRVGREFRSAPIGEFDFIGSRIKHRIDVCLSLKVPIGVSCTAFDSPFESGPPQWEDSLEPQRRSQPPQG